MSEKIINNNETEERKYLEHIKGKLSEAILEIENLVGNQYEEIIEQKKYLAESKADMDHVEKVSVRQSIEQMAMIGDHSLAKKKRLHKIIQSPYFGRIDFSSNSSDTKEPIYIGIHTFVDSENDQNLIYDWRAPISSMFYDFELGDAYYEAPEGITEGKIFLKRQYRIKNGSMEYMLQSSLNVIDDVLQKELSKSSDDKMKNIVATIQRDQNAIIRNDESTTLIIQGAAGSGKTSIALHRIAFLLYKYKDSIKSSDILIISPNKVFGDYISNVLPELGEDKILETSMENLADEIFKYQYKFQNFYEQVALLLDKNDESFRERIKYKSSNEFLRKLDEYIINLKRNNLSAKDISTQNYLIPDWFIEERFKTYQRMQVDKRITNIVNDLIDSVKTQFDYEIKGKERNEIRKQLNQMFRTTSLRVLYREFYDWAGKPEMFKLAKGSVYEYADVFPFIYLKIQMEGLKGFDNVKHLVVDEMQDYTPVQYRVISRLFKCKKTILGDSNQSVNPFSSSTAESISSVFPKADCMYMNKSYRSTIEISEFAQKIQRNEKLEPIERHGEVPQIKKHKSKNDEISEIKYAVTEFDNTDFNSLGVICKTQKQADKLYEALKDLDPDISLLTSESTSFSEGIIITSAHMSKGLEFDQVIVPFCTAENYKTKVDRHMLYVACTRAMHKLTLTYTGEHSEFLNSHLAS